MSIIVSTSQRTVGVEENHLHHVCGIQTQGFRGSQGVDVRASAGAVFGWYPSSVHTWSSLYPEAGCMYSD